MLKIYKAAYGSNTLKGNLALKYSLLVSLFFLFAGKLKAQNPPRQEIDINQFIQTLFPVPSEDSNYEDLYESLFQLYANPLDLNTASSDELAATFILTNQQIQSLLAHRVKLGPFISLYELQSVPGFDLATIYRLLPFVTVEPRQMSLKQSLKNPSQHFLMLRSGRLLEQQKGFSEIDTTSRSTSRYKGNPLYGYIRYRNARTGVYSFGLTIEKDAGEKWWEWKPGRQIFGPDFSSFHAQIMNRRKLKNLIIGDFQMQAGQGMVMAAGFSLGKGSEVIRTTYRSTLGLRPYTSVLEANFFRGIAATYAISKQVEVTSFYSRTRRDASIDENSDENMVSSLLISGYHRTPAEREKHNTISEQNIGLHGLYKIPSQKGQIGITLLNTNYGSYLLKKDVPYNLFEFRGKHNLTTGIHGDYRWQNFHFFGEGARSGNGGKGGIAGLIAGLGKTFDFTMLLRHYDKNFHTFYGNSVSEATRPINESGTYWGLRYSPNRRWQFSTYYDRFNFPWLKYQINAPSGGYDIYLHVLWKPNKRFNAYALFHEKHKPHNLPEANSAISPVAESVRRSALINIEYEVPLRFSVRTRLQGGDFGYKKNTSSRGFTILQDITWKFSRIEFSGRFAFFATDDYDSRQYVYEKDMLYAFSLPAYYDRGTRHYLMARYNLSKHMKVWLRWSQTRYSRLETISSALNEIKGNKRSELKMQVMYQF
ncbi:helix-hairpin-helix domain-containing protein [Dyadobacter sp. CY312]|uniref:ComEA family DNA-binding protein n=1 Tax=Dyadobacter sp. CY312 TaxID=2907303 RepID=UPI001F396CC0|nr:helix-hairpin-helix domain-containing protein [Dyadobacter sp. CY312]MCE7043086.1 helix-hairpin-helix domain-containing protein [Dyadobacter sp. CY312]